MPKQEDTQGISNNRESCEGNHGPESDSNNQSEVSCISEPAPNEGVRINLLVEGYGQMAILVDAEYVNLITAPAWFVGYQDMPVTTIQGVSIPLHRWLSGAGIDRQRCVVFLNRDPRDFRRSNLFVVSRSLLSRVGDPRRLFAGWPGRTLCNIKQTRSGKYVVQINYRTRRITSPVCADLNEAFQVRIYILSLIEADLRVLWGNIQLPPTLAIRVQLTIDHKIARIEEMPNPQFTPVHNIYRAPSVLGLRYQYRFKYRRRIYARDGFRSIWEAVEAYNERVLTVTGDVSRIHDLSRISETE